MLPGDDIGGGVKELLSFCRRGLASEKAPRSGVNSAAGKRNANGNYNDGREGSVFVSKRYKSPVFGKAGLKPR
jgi:hypothetical protein